MGGQISKGGRILNRGLAFRDIHGQSINSVHYTFPFDGRVDRQFILNPILPLNTPFETRTSGRTI